MIKRLMLLTIPLAAIVLGALYTQGGATKEFVDHIAGKAVAMLDHKEADTPKAKPGSTAVQGEKKAPSASAPAITVARVTTADFKEHVVITGSLKAREQILVAPEVEGLRILSYEVEEGDTVEKGQRLATLERITLQSSLDQNTAAIERADAQIAQAQSQINETEALLKEANAALRRARPLVKKGHLSKSTFDTREAAARSTRARLESAQNGISLAQANKRQLEAQRREIAWRLTKSEIRSPVAGLVVHRQLRIGDTTSSAKTPLFEIAKDGEIELEAEIDEPSLAKVRQGQQADVKVAGLATVTGKVRLVSPQIDALTRLGHARIFLGANPQLRIGAFARGSIETDHSTGNSIPATAVLYSSNNASVLRVIENKVHATPIQIGLRTGTRVEVIKGLKLGDLIVAKAGTFLRDGDQIRPVEPGAKPDTTAHIEKHAQGQDQGQGQH